jgi:peptide/nickel transport system substrate-binding protein
LIIDYSTVDVIESAGYKVNALRIGWQGLVLMDRDGAMVPALADPRVRQAMNYAIDRDGLLAASLSGHGQVTSQYFNPATDGYSEDLDDYYSYDPEKARELLAEAGYPEGFALTMPSSAAINPTLLTLIQSLLGDVGIDVTYEDAGTNFVTDMIAGKYAASWFQLGGSEDWLLSTMAVTPTAVFNPFKTQRPEVDALLTTVKTGDEEAAAAAARELNTYLVEEAWFSSFYFIDGVFVTNPDVSVTMPTDQPAPYLYMMTTS